jgi:hypothetical protein
MAGRNDRYAVVGNPIFHRYRAPNHTYRRVRPATGKLIKELKVPLV